MRSSPDSRRIARESGSNFYPAFLFLSRPRREALCAVYAFSRQVDDTVDHGGDPTTAAQQLRQWREVLLRCYREEPSGSFAELAEAVKRFRIPQKYFSDLLTGCELDLGKKRYASFSELSEYCYYVAGSIGLICNRIFGAEGADYDRYAVRLGTAFQLTNILRDVGTDWERGRIYIPLEEMRRFDYSEADLNRKAENRQFLDLMSFEAERARRYFREAKELLREKRLERFLPAEIMSRFYGALLAKLERDRFPVFRKKVALGRSRKLGLIVASLVKSLL